ncbi:MAG TPA: tRNA (5-methylaminomethyl-2-thiouridine)(34)-methyltransferase MnmD [Pseudomonadales bacterium]
MIEPAALVWRDRQPYSAGFQDIYHSPDGRDEVERVFLAPAGFREMLAGGGPLRVGELGFGTGLNFAIVARHCLRAGVRLHFVSFEAAPLRHEDLERICRDRQADEPVYTELLSRYPPLLGGWHHRRLHGGRTLLSIYFGPAGEGLADLRAQHHQPFDLWLLDGFAPDRNPDMWADDLLAAVGSTCLQGARVTTFTSAGRVRRGLAAAGFQMRRVDQRPRKRESLAGVFTGPGLAKRPAPERVTVVGAGIAGAATARSLAEAGIAARVVERSPAPAAGASRIPATVMHPRLHHDGSPGALLKATAYAHALAAVAPLADQPETGVRRTGALQIPSPNYPPERLAAVAEQFAPCGIRVALVEGREAAQLAGSAALRLDSPVLWFADACLVSTPELTRTLLAHPLIELCTGMPLAEWPEEPCVLACGMDARRLAGASYLELGRVYGQLDLLRPRSTALAGLAVPIVGNGYVTPLPGNTAADPLIASGATYEYAPWPAGRATERNLLHVTRLAAEGATPTAAVRAERTVSSDRQPVIGPLFDIHGREIVGRLVSVGHGSMGTVSSHLAADLLAARLGGDFEPLAAPGRALVTPLRFRERQARRGYRFGAEP